MRFRPIALALSLAATPGFALSARATTYNVIPLQGEGGSVSQPYAINASGESVGYAQTASGGDDAVLWAVAQFGFGWAGHRVAT